MITYLSILQYTGVLVYFQFVSRNILFHVCWQNGLQFLRDAYIYFKLLLDYCLYTYTSLCIKYQGCIFPVPKDIEHFYLGCLVHSVFFFLCKNISSSLFLIFCFLFLADFQSPLYILDILIQASTATHFPLLLLCLSPGEWFPVLWHFE